MILKNSGRQKFLTRILFIHQEIRTKTILTSFILDTNKALQKIWTIRNNYFQTLYKLDFGNFVTDKESKIFEIKQQKKYKNNA